MGIPPAAVVRPNLMSPPNAGRAGAAATNVLMVTGVVWEGFAGHENAKFTSVRQATPVDPCPGKVIINSISRKGECSADVREWVREANVKQQSLTDSTHDCVLGIALNLTDSRGKPGVSMVNQMAINTLSQPEQWPSKLGSQQLGKANSQHVASGMWF
ncbi:hypothetical protein WISP_93729 [Willisornis vidua]|uniref:Uncharacterized protein n=1 Tax=Willisornis vidua TaxID=1566151 RepID=A0ABQ9D5J1_9PASS|nr:hypothetical protein WISP_93729 [Willisornis vidua]